jgi:hypothetical protein
LLPRSKEKWTKRRGGWVRLIFCISSMLTPMFDHEFPHLWWNPRILMVKSLSSAKCSSVNPPGGCLPSLPGGGCACRLHQMVGISGASVEVYRAVEHEEFMKKVGCFSPNQVSRTSVLVDTWGLTLKNGSCLDRYPSYGDIFRQETWGTESDQVRSIRFYGDMGPHWDPIGTSKSLVSTKKFLPSSWRHAAIFEEMMEMLSFCKIEHLGSDVLPPSEENHGR